MEPIKELRRHLLQYTVTGLRRVGEESGVPWQTLWKIRSGATRNPRFQTTQRLAEHFGVALTGADRRSLDRVAPGLSQNDRLSDDRADRRAVARQT